MARKSKDSMTAKELLFQESGKPPTKLISVRIRTSICDVLEKQAENKKENISTIIKKAVEDYYSTDEFEHILNKYEELDDIGAISPVSPEEDIREHLPEFMSVLNEFINESERILFLRKRALKIKQKLDLVDKMDKYCSSINQAKSKSLSAARNLIYTALNMTSLLDENKYETLECLLGLIDKKDELRELEELKTKIDRLGGNEGIIRAMHSY